MIQVKNIDHLKELASSDKGEMQDFFISLAGGIARSSKRIIYFSSTCTFDIFNEIDDSLEDDLTVEQLESQTNIISVLKAGALYKY